MCSQIMEFQYAIFATVILSIGGWQGATALPLCDVNNCTSVANSECSGGQGQPCVCASGFHENPDNTSCVSDVTPGMACTLKNSTEECVSDATCINTTPEGDTETLQCTCNDGYRPITPAPPVETSPGCEPAVLPNCVPTTLCGAAANTFCAGVGQRCECNADYHENKYSTACEPDILPGENCTRRDSNHECVKNASCVNMATEGAPELLKCTCDHGFHPSGTLEGSEMCVKDIRPGDECEEENTNTECVDGATCKSSTVSVTVLECTCDDGYHKFEQMGITSCAPDIALGGECTKKDDATECISGAMCVDTSSADDSEVLKCTCNDGFHSQTVNGSTVCAEDLWHEQNCTMRDSDAECVNNATCVNVAPDSAAEVLQCICKDGFHPKVGTSGTFCEADLEPGSPCIFKDDNSECKDNATCVDVAPEGALAPDMRCRCDDGFHEGQSETNDAECQLDLSPGMPCTDEYNSDRECKEHANCVNVAPEGNTADLRCTCDTHYHKEGETQGSATCVADTCQDSLGKCSAMETDECSKLNNYVKCTLSGVCNGSVPEDVSRTKEALAAARGNISADCGFTPGPNPTCLDKLTLCLNTFLKAELTCGASSALRICLNSAACGAEDENAKMVSLVREVQVQVHAELSCTCVEKADECMETPTTQYNTANNNTARCKAVTAMFQCAMTPSCDVSKTTDAQKLSSIWSSALTKVRASSCAISEADATSCPLKLTRCSVAYATGLNSANTKAKKCSIVESFEQCVGAVSSPCDSSYKKIHLQELSAAVSSFSCECSLGLRHCWNSFNQSLQADTTANGTCRAISEYQSCLAKTHCNMTDPVDSAQVFSYVSAAHETKTDKDCEVSAGTGCHDNLNACADKYTTAMQDSDNSDGICSASLDLVLCARAAKCNNETEAERTAGAEVVQSAMFRHTTLSCKAITCDGTYATWAMCETNYDGAFSDAGDNDASKCTAANTLVECMNNLVCNDHLKTVIRAKYTAVKNLKIQDCALKGLSDTSSSPPLRTSAPIVILTAISTVWFVRTLYI